MFRRHLNKLSYTRCFLPAMFVNKNVFDQQGTEVLENKKVGGWQGVVNAFSLDENGNPTAELRAISSTVCYSGLLGGIYGSFSYSKKAYDEFFLKNQSTLFRNQFEAKTKLQSQITLAMCRGVVKWGSKVVLFCAPFTTIVTITNAYKQDVSLWGYAIAGFIIGGVAKINFGMNGFLVGSTLGTILGVIVGSLTLLMLKFSPLNMQELKEWQSQSQKERDEFFIKDIKTSSIFKYDEPPELLEHGKRHALPNVETLTNDDVKH